MAPVAFYLQVGNPPATIEGCPWLSAVQDQAETAIDESVFRATPLRNVELTARYFHSGAVWSPEEAVAIMSVAQLRSELNDEEVADAAAVPAHAHRRGVGGGAPDASDPHRHDAAARRPLTGG